MALKGAPPTTAWNSKAVIEGLRALREPCAITISTDSQYVQRGITEWLETWKANGWRKSKNTKGGRSVLNQDLWAELDKRLASHHCSVANG